MRFSREVAVARITTDVPNAPEGTDRPSRWAFSEIFPDEAMEEKTEEVFRWDWVKERTPSVADLAAALADV